MAIRRTIRNDEASARGARPAAPEAGASPAAFLRPGWRPGCPCADGGRCAERYGNLLEQAVEGVFVADESGVCSDVNPAGARMLGFSRDEILGCRLLKTVATVDASRLAEAIGELRSGQTVHRAKRFRRKDGTTFPGELSARRLSDGNIQCILRDVTERRQAERAARRSEKKFSRLFRASPDAIVLTERDSGRILEANDSFLRIFGLTGAQVRGRTALALGFWPDAAMREGFLAELRRRGSIREFEMTWRHPAGHRVGLLSAEAIELDGVSCILTVATDRTDARRAERERLEAAERERRSQEDFTRRLIESQEAERRRIAGELHDSLGQDLLLIKTRLQLALGGGVVAADVKSSLEQVVDLATQAVAEVRRLAHALRPPQLDHLGLTGALRAMLDTVAKTAAFRLDHRIDDVDGVFQPEEEVGWYRLLQEALNNILKHARARRVDVLLEHDVRSVRLIVADDGCGFVVAGAEVGGLGLRNIGERVRILGGRWRVDSAPATGTRLEIEVPLPAEVV